MAADVSALDGFFKVRYADKMENLVPAFAKVAKIIPFKTGEKTGSTYQFPVRLRRSMGITWAGGADYGTAFALNSPVSGVLRNATLTGTEFVLTEYLSYGAISKATSNIEAFGSAFDETVSDMATAAAFAREMALLYGGGSIGTIASVTNPNATTCVAIISAATWAPGLWVQMEGALLDGYNGSTKENDSSPTAAYTVTNVNTDTRAITVTGEATDITALTANDVLIPYGAYGKWFSGVDTITSNTGSLFGIDAATYGLWKSSTYAAGGVALTMAKITAAAAKVTTKGGMRDLVAFVSTFTWSDLNSDLAALKRVTSSVKGGIDQGTEGADGNLTYYGPNGSISIHPHPMVKASEAFLVDPRTWKRIGSSDITFGLPGSPPGQQPNFFSELPNNAGVSLRCYWDQSLINSKPASACKITGITNTAS